MRDLYSFRQKTKKVKGKWIISLMILDIDDKRSVYYLSSYLVVVSNDLDTAPIKIKSSMLMFGEFITVGRMIDIVGFLHK